MQLVCPAGNLPSLGSQLGIDATHQWSGEEVAWGDHARLEPAVALDAAVDKCVDALWLQVPRGR